RAAVRRGRSGPRGPLPSLLDIGQEAGDEADQGEEGAQPVYVLDAAAVGHASQHGGSDASHPEGEAEEEPRDQPHPAGQELLRVYEDRGESRGQHQPYDDRQDGGPEEIRVGKGQGEGSHAQDRTPDHVLAAVAVAYGAADQGAGGDRELEEEEVELRRPYGQLEAVDQEEGEIAVHSREVEVLREDEDEEDEHGYGRPAAGYGRAEVLRPRAGRLLPRGDRPGVPSPDARQHDYADQGQRGEPDYARSPADGDDHGREEGPEGGAAVASDLED